MDMIGSLKQKVSRELKKHASHATLYDGALKGADMPFRCLIVENANLAGYLIARTYMENPRILKKRRVWIPALKRIIEKREDDIDLCIAVLPARYDAEFQGLYGFRGQEWVNQTLDVSITWEEIRARFHANPHKTERKIMKYGFTYRVSNDTKDFDLFYHSMYVPHAIGQFGEQAYVESYDDVRSYFEKGFLLFVMENGKPVSGGLCLVGDRILTFRRLGVIDGDKEYIFKGAQSSLYFFIIRYAHDRGLREVDFMKSRPFLNDGRYRHKQEWGASVSPDKESETSVYYFNAGEPEKISAFYENNPLIVPVEGGMAGVVGRSGSTVISDESIKELEKLYYAPGLKGLKLLAPGSARPIDISFEEASKAQT
ncbi:MAG: hypothetical protein HY889_10630 [Deltaproteobacteria bacterium]|nr:hypothetical protein [Deltaproteobacteria bacterium]